jgi:hypothetical protein
MTSYGCCGTFLPHAPHEFGPAVGYLTVPAEEELPAHLHGRLVSALILCYAGPIDEGERVIEPFRALGPEADLVAPVTYADFQCSIDDPPGYRNRWTADYFHVVTDEAFDAVHAHSLRTPSPGRRSRSSSPGAGRWRGWARRRRR